MLEIKQLTRLQIIRYCEKLEKENKKLKSDLAFKSTMLDNVRAEYESTQNVIKKMKAELERYKKQYEHSMGWDYIDKDLYDLDC